MNTDFRIAVGMTTHPKTIKLMRRCGDRAFFCLINLWSWAALHKPDGNFAGMDGEDVEIIAGWEGEEGAFAEQLCAVGFMDCDNGKFSLHDWLEHNPWAAGSNERSDAGRMNKLKGIMPDKWAELSEKGVTWISKSDYEAIKKGNKKVNISPPSSPTQPPLGVGPSGPFTPTPTPTPTPSPSPSPSPTPNVKEKEIVAAAAPVRSRSRAKEDEAEAEEKFAEFWEAYPRKENRKKALAAWKRGQCWNGKFQEIMAALTEQKKNPRWLEDVKYIPHPTTWLNGERWADEISTGRAPSCSHTCSSCQHSEHPDCRNRAEQIPCEHWRSR